MTTQPALMDMISRHESFSASDLERVIKLHRERGGLLAELLVQEGMISEEDLFFLFSSELGVPVIPEERLKHLKLSSELRRKVPRELASERQLIPLDLDAKNGLLSVVMFDPSDSETLEILRERCGLTEIRCYLARRGAIRSAMAAVYDSDKTPKRSVGRRPGPVAKRPPRSPAKPAKKTPVRRSKKAPSRPRKPSPEASAPSQARKAPAKKASEAPPGKAGPRTRTRPRPQAKPAKKAPARAANPRPRPPPTPIPTEPKVELDPALRQEIAAMKTRPGRMVRTLDRQGGPLHEEPTALIARPAQDTDEVTTPPMTDSRLSLREVRGRSLFRDQTTETTKLFREVDTVAEPCTEELDLSDIEIEGDLEQTPKVIELSSEDRVEELGPEELTVLDSDDLDMTPPLPAVDANSTPLLPLPGDSGLTPLPDVTHMEELDALLRELLSSVGVLVSMLEERIDSSGGVCREHGQLARMVAREAGMDELTISRVALAAYLHALDITLRTEVGEQGPGDVVAAFCLNSGSTGGLGPSLRTLGARALGLADDGGGAETPGLKLVRLVAQFLSLRAQSGQQGTDLDTVIQLLKAGADASLVDALTRALEGAERTMVMRSPPGFLD